MATFPPVPYNLIDSRVINNTVGSADAALAASTLTVQASNPMLIQWRDIFPGGFVHTAFAAGTAQITTIDTTSATVVAGVTQTMYIRRLDNNDVFQIQVVPPTTSVATLATMFIAKINAQAGTIVTALSTGANTFTMTEVGNIGGFIVTMVDTGITVVTGTPHVNSCGTYSEVVQYDPNALAGGQFDKYQITGKPIIPENSGQANVLRKGQWVIWVEKNDAQFAAFNTAITGWFDGSGIAALADTQKYLEII
jgi:hypothetical protein